jgi:hypothetical protein
LLGIAGERVVAAATDAEAVTAQVAGPDGAAIADRDPDVSTEGPAMGRRGSADSLSVAAPDAEAAPSFAGTAVAGLRSVALVMQERAITD